MYSHCLCCRRITEEVKTKEVASDSNDKLKFVVIVD